MSGDLHIVFAHPVFALGLDAVANFLPAGPYTVQIRVGGVNGVNPYDRNATDGPLGGSLYATGKHTGTNHAYTLSDSTKHWTANQWSTKNSGYVYVLRNTTGANPSSPSPANIISNTANSITFANYSGAVEKLPPLYFNSGDSYEIRKVLVALDQVGQGKGDLRNGLPFTPASFPNTVLEPCYSWNNWTNAAHSDQLDFVSNQGQMKEGRDFFNRTPKPGYTPYIYPHPLTGGTTPPPLAPPTNLRVVH